MYSVLVNASCLALSVLCDHLMKPSNNRKAKTSSIGLAHDDVIMKRYAFADLMPLRVHTHAHPQAQTHAPLLETHTRKRRHTHPCSREAWA